MLNPPLLVALAAIAAASIAPFAAASPTSALVSLEIYDRTERTVLRVHEKDGRHYVIGTPGHEYAVRIRNASARRVLAVTSVDGVNVVTGETASPQQSGYVIAPWESVEIAGWRKSLASTAAFYFTDLGDSYAARTGRPLDVGVIGVAVFTEKPPRLIAPDRIGTVAPSTVESGDARGDGSRAERDAGPPASANESRARQEPAESPGPHARGSTPRIGTGHGREESAPAQQVRFDRESTFPAQTIVVQYDRLENLVALGVLPSPRFASRDPNPFPGLRFVPDPPR